MIFRTAIVLLAFLVFQGCGNEKVEEQAPLENVQGIQLTNENVTLKVPAKFKRSSMYRLKSDIPELEEDSVRLRAVEDFLYKLEFEDSDIDVFVDTTLGFGLFYILNVDYYPFDKYVGSFISSDVEKNFSKLEDEFPELSVEKIEPKMRQSSLMKMLKLKYNVRNSFFPDQSTFTSFFLLSTADRSYLIYEISEDTLDLEEYLWTLKD